MSKHEHEEEAMTGQQIVAEAAKRVASSHRTEQFIIAAVQREFAPFAELIEAAKAITDKTYDSAHPLPPGLVLAELVVLLADLRGALAEVEKMGG